MASARINFEDFNATLRAVGEETRLRILVLLADAELTVSELTEILRQSQPRISRHLKLLGGGRPGGALSRGRLGVFPSGRTWRRGRSRPPPDRRDRSGRSGHLPATASGWPVCARSGSKPPRTIFAATRPTGIVSAACMRRMTRSRPEISKLLIEPSVPLAARPRHRHRPHSRTVRPRDRAWRSASISPTTCWRSPATASIMPGPEELQCSPGRHFRPGVAARLLRCRHRPSGAAFPRRWRTGHRARPRGCCARVAGCWWSILPPHEFEFLREEHAHRRLGFSRRHGVPVDGAGRARRSWSITSLAPEPGSESKIAVSLWLAHDPRICWRGQREVA